jgi:hypothetical protein
MSTDSEKANCKRKTRYPTEHDAKRSIARLRDKRGINKSFRIYKCPVCFGYHLTSSPKQ